MRREKAPQTINGLLASRDPGVPAEIDVPNAPLSTLVTEAAEAFPQQIALDFFGATTTYRDLSRQIMKAAEVLRRLGVQAGDPVALVLPNCPQHVVAFYAIARLGAIVVEHNPLASPADFARQFQDHRAKVVIVWQNAFTTVETAREQLGDADAIEHVISVDMSQALPRKLRFALKLPVPAARAKRAQMCASVPATLPRWEELVEKTSPLSRKHPLPDADDVAVLLYTGGTTGTPKGAKLTHRNLMSNCAQGKAWVPVMTEGKETFYAVLPFFHAFGLTLIVLFGMRMASTVVLFPKPDLSLIADAQKKRPGTFISAVPTLFDKLTTYAESHKLDLTSFRVAISGAMALPKEVAYAWERATGGMLIEGYGMTETAPCIVGNPVSDERRPGCLGLPFPSTELRICDPKDPERVLPAGEDGELQVRGPQVFSGYWNNPEETATVLLPDGWLRTGDQVTIDHGFVRMTDRIKDVIITGGFNVYPSHVEDTLRTMNGIDDISVVGLPSGSGGEKVVAALVLKSGVRVDLAAVRAFASDRLSRYAIPKEIFVLEDLPRSQIGKVLRRVVREQIIARQGAPAT